MPAFLSPSLAQLRSQRRCRPVIACNNLTRSPLCSTIRPPAPASLPAIPEEKPYSIPPVIFVLGGPGCGKGTQCSLLQKSFPLAQLCVGDLLRREASAQSDVGILVADIMQRGDIVPGHITMSLLRRKLNAMAGACSAVLIDGFPRAMDQALQFEQSVSNCEFVLYFDCAPRVMMERLRRRAATSSRADDVEDVFAKRLATFEKKTMPVIEHYNERGLLRRIDAQDGGIDEVFERTKREFDQLFL